ncbi:MAG: cyclophilin-like fold protein, partial [Nitrososphaerales archaeon]|nr:cyclophilin-like fold protein [Nitrososphaerales archaeon]
IELLFDDGIKVDGELDESKNPITTRAIVNALPIESRANRWGDEIYFSTPVNVGEENAQEEVRVGDIAYWPPGKALCIFFGPTPVSRGSEPRAASPVNVIGRVKGDLTLLKKVKNRSKVIVRIKGEAR